MHNAGAHLADYVEGWGPLWAWSTFGFEDMNGTLMDFCHGTGNVCRQVSSHKNLVRKCHRLDFRRSGEERGLLSRTTAGNRA